MIAEPLCPDLVEHRPVTLKLPVRTGIPGPSTTSVSAAPAAARIAWRLAKSCSASAPRVLGDGILQRLGPEQRRHVDPTSGLDRLWHRSSVRRRVVSADDPSEASIAIPSFCGYRRGQSASYPNSSCAGHFDGPQTTELQCDSRSAHPEVAAMVLADSPLVCIRCASATFDWSSAFGRPMDCPRALRASRAAVRRSLPNSNSSSARLARHRPPCGPRRSTCRCLHAVTAARSPAHQASPDRLITSAALRPSLSMPTTTMASPSRA